MSRNEGSHEPYLYAPNSNSWIPDSTLLQAYAEAGNEDISAHLGNGHHLSNGTVMSSTHGDIRDNTIWETYRDGSIDHPRFNHSHLGNGHHLSNGTVMSFTHGDIRDNTIGETYRDESIDQHRFNQSNTSFQIELAGCSIRPSTYDFTSSNQPPPTPTIRPSMADYRDDFTGSNEPPPISDTAQTTDMSRLQAVEADGTFWSGTGHKYDVDYEILGSNLKEQLMSGTALGHGAAGTVQRVVCRGIPLARKSIRTTTSAALGAAKSEVEAIRNLRGHHHIVQLVGTYITTDHGHTMYHLLTFPVADCDMDTFLNDCESFFHNNCSDSSLQTISQASKIGPTKVQFELPFFIKKSLGCITNGIQWMHDAEYSHEDIKASNILLRAGEIYITDFGISRNRRNAEDTSTETYPGSSHGWCAPEKREKHNPYFSDVYSLGCFFMHVITVLSLGKRRSDCFDILQSPPQYRERCILDHFLSLQSLDHFLSMQSSSDGTYSFSYDIVDLTIQMLRNDRHSRPSISDVNGQLISVAGATNVFHNSCCFNGIPAPEPSSADTPTSTYTPNSGYALGPRYPPASECTPAPSYQCDRGSCEARAFQRADNFSSHLRKAHNLSRDEAANIVEK